MATRPELLSPAGDMERLNMALTFGANAVYLSGTRYGMRGGCANFDEDALRKAVKLCHEKDVRVHITVNTLPRDDEMVTAGLSAKTGRRMGHMSLSGPAGTIEAFRTIEVGQKVIIHMNNSNPVLLADSPERAEAEAAGWIVAHDGLEFVL